MRSDGDLVAEPFYFGPGERRLYGCFHSAGPRSRGAVLLCPPIGHEAIQFHRALRELATLLAAAGFGALRFDYLGCGDSSGGSPDWSLEAWQGDVALAVEELRRRSAVARPAAVGLRIGGTVVVRHALEHGDLGDLVLWDPVVDGRAFLEQQARAHREMIDTAHVVPAKDDPDAPTEFLGFVFPARLESELEALSLTAAIERAVAERVYLVESHPAVSQRSFEEALAASGCEVRRRRLENPHLWTWVEDFARLHVPRKILDGIVAWLGGGAR